MECPSCNKQNPEDAKFCNNCATPLVSTQELAISTKEAQRRATIEQEDRERGESQAKEMLVRRRRIEAIRKARGENWAVCPSCSHENVAVAIEHCTRCGYVFKDLNTQKQETVDSNLVEEEIIPLRRSSPPPRLDEPKDSRSLIGTFGNGINGLLAIILIGGAAIVIILGALLTLGSILSALFS